jgi:hypothetical protein
MRLFGQLLVLSLAVTVAVALADSNVDIIEKSSTSILNRVKRQCKCVNNQRELSYAIRNVYNGSDLTVYIYLNISL